MHEEVIESTKPASPTGLDLDARNRRSVQARRVAGRAGVYGGLAVSAWLLTSVATGVAAAEDGSSSPSSGGSSSTSQGADEKKPAGSEPDAGSKPEGSSSTKPVASFGSKPVKKSSTARPSATAKPTTGGGGDESATTRGGASGPSETSSVTANADVPPQQSDVTPVVRRASTPSSTTRPLGVARATTASNDASGLRATPTAAIQDAATNPVAAVSSTAATPSPSAPSKPPNVVAAVLEFVRRSFFNQSPVVTDVQINRPGPNGVITGDIDAKDPDELGKRVQIRSTVFAGAPSPAACGCEEVPGYIALAFTNPAVLGGNPGDNWNAPNAVDRTTVYLKPDFSVAYYAGTETGNVTIDGLGSGDVHLDFVGNLNATGTSEKSVATLNPDLGTGDLKGVEGTVTSESALNADGTANGVLTGEVYRPEIRYRVVRQPSHGTVTVDEVTGSFTYTADPAFLAAGGGADSFQVLVSDSRPNLLQVFRPYNGDPVQTIDLRVV